MSKIIVVGAGRVGVAIARLLTTFTDDEVLIIESNENTLRVARKALPTCRLQHAGSIDDLKQALIAESPNTVVCCTPFNVNIEIAKVCNQIAANYIDFTEDVSVTEAVTKIAPTESTFVLQTGLAPGLVTSVGLAMVEKLRKQQITPWGLELRVGALPLVASHPSGYSLTWSGEGLINEYYQPVQQLVRGAPAIAEPLAELEELIVDGRRMEAFNTSGGLGDLTMYKGLFEANYKTMRYPGHLAFLQDALIGPLKQYTGEQRIKAGVVIADQLFNRSRDDVVYMVIRAWGLTLGGQKFETTFQHRFYPQGGLTALELTTAGTGAAVVELISGLPKGIVFGGKVELQDLFNTKVGRTFLGPCSLVL